MKSTNPTPVMVLFLGLLLSQASAHAGASRYCLKLLTQADVQALPAEIETTVAERTAPLKVMLRSGQGAPEIQAIDGSMINVLEGINRELAKPVLDSAKRAVLARLDELARKWSTAAKEEVKLRYEELKKAKISVEVDGDGVPRTELSQANREAVLAVLKAAKARMGAVEIETQLVSALIEARKKEIVAEVKEKADLAIDKADSFLAETRGKVSPDWNSVHRETEPLAIAFAAELAAKFPLTRVTAKGTKSSREAAAAAAGQVAPLVTAQINQHGVPELAVPEIGIRAYYDIDLGTVVLESAKGLLPNADGMLLVVDHGDGTVKSNASSWKYVLPKFVDSDFNPVAMNLPKSGIGMDITGFYRTTEYLDRRYQILRQRVTPSAGQPLMPMVLVGRSMGASKGFAHSFLHDGAQNPVDAYVLTSFSNPLTMEMQVKNVYQQVADGTIKGVVPEMLENAKSFSQEMLSELGRLKAQDPKAFDDNGENMLFEQGNSDEDGGPTVVADLESFTSQFAPRAHVYIFKNRLLKYDIPNFKKIDPEKWEGTHTLFSNLPNYSREKLGATLEYLEKEGVDKLPTKDREVYEALKYMHEHVLPNDYPALQDQYFEAIAVMKGFFDYIADSHSSALARQKQVFAAHRAKVTGGKSYLEAYADEMKIGHDEVHQASPEGSSRASRLKRVQEYWKTRREAAKDYK